MRYRHIHSLINILIVTLVVVADAAVNNISDVFAPEIVGSVLFLPPSSRVLFVSHRRPKQSAERRKGRRTHVCVYMSAKSGEGRSTGVGKKEGKGRNRSTIGNTRSQAVGCMLH